MFPLAPLYPHNSPVLLVVHAHINPEKAAAAPAAPPLVWRWGTQALWQMIHGPWPPERSSWLVVVLAVTQGGSDEVLAHSHSSREGLQSHAVHSFLWLLSGISAEPITVWDSQRCFGTHVLLWGGWIVVSYWGSGVQLIVIGPMCRKGNPLFNPTLPKCIHNYIACIYLMINYHAYRTTNIYSICQLLFLY